MCHRTRTAEAIDATRLRELLLGTPQTRKIATAKGSSAATRKQKEVLLDNLVGIVAVQHKLAPQQ
jgi:hypothetical protein